MRRQMNFGAVRQNDPVEFADRRQREVLDGSTCLGGWNVPGGVGDETGACANAAEPLARDIEAAIQTSPMILQFIRSSSTIGRSIRAMAMPAADNLPITLFCEECVRPSVVFRDN